MEISKNIFALVPYYLRFLAPKSTGICISQRHIFAILPDSCHFIAKTVKTPQTLLVCVVVSPRPPPSWQQAQTQTLSSASLSALCHNGSGLRLCRQSRRQPLPAAILAVGSYPEAASLPNCFDAVNLPATQTAWLSGLGCKAHDLGFFV